MYRIAETYLLRAEAYWWKDQINKTMEDINAVRTRANCAPYTDISQIDIGTVLDERARELFWEEPRTTELHRIAFIFALTGKSYNGKSYSVSNFGESNFYFDWVWQHNNFYNEGVIANNGQTYTIAPYHVLWPIPQTAINSNPLGVINQNFGYVGYENNVPALDAIPMEDDI